LAVVVGSVVLFKRWLRQRHERLVALHGEDHTAAVAEHEHEHEHEHVPMIRLRRRGKQSSGGRNPASGCD